MTACIAASIFVCSAAGLVAAYGMWGKDHMAMNQCVDSGGVYNKDWVTCDKTTVEKPQTTFSVYTGPVYVGVFKGKTVRLQLQDDSQKYRMIQDGLRIVGDINTERGFDKDDNATVYVLNPNAQDSKQIRFVASTSDGKPELLLLGQKHQVQKEVTLRPAQ